jgi:hypothetical protein
MARLKHARRCTAQTSLERIIYEVPLDSWRDVAGSAVKSGDFVKAVAELANIYWTFLRPSARGLHSPTPPAQEFAAGTASTTASPAQQKAA